MIKLVIVLDRKEGWSFEEFVDYWENEHAPMVAELPNLKRYEMCLAADPEAEPHDGVAEMYFEDGQAMAEAFETDLADRVKADASEFAEWDGICAERRVLVDETG